MCLHWQVPLIGDDSQSSCISDCDQNGVRISQYLDFMANLTNQHISYTALDWGLSNKWRRGIVCFFFSSFQVIFPPYRLTLGFQFGKHFLRGWLVSLATPIFGIIFACSGLPLFSWTTKFPWLLKTHSSTTSIMHAVIVWAVLMLVFLPVQVLWLHHGKLPSTQSTELSQPISCLSWCCFQLCGDTTLSSPSTQTPTEEL